MTDPKPRLLLVPMLTELEWLIKPQLEEWAEVASYDAPGVGDEQPVEPFGTEAIADRGLAELDRRGWDRCIVVADEFGVAAAATLVHARPDAVSAIAFGHARLANTFEGERPTMHPEIFAGLSRLARHEPRTFVRQLFKLSGGEERRGGYGEDLAESYLERVPFELTARFYESRPHAGVRIRESLEVLDVPMLLVRHEGCILFTDEGFEDAAEAFPHAQTAQLPEKPSSCAQFSDLLKDFCTEAL